MVEWMNKKWKLDFNYISHSEDSGLRTNISVKHKHWIAEWCLDLPWIILSVNPFIVLYLIVQGMNEHSTRTLGQDACRICLGWKCSDLIREYLRSTRKIPVADVQREIVVELIWTPRAHSAMRQCTSHDTIEGMDCKNCLLEGDCTQPCNANGLTSVWNLARGAILIRTWNRKPYKLLTEVLDLSTVADWSGRQRLGSEILLLLFHRRGCL